MAAFVSGARFGVKAAIRIGVFLALMFGFRSVVHGLAVASGPLIYGVIIIAGLYLKPLITVVLIISMIRPCWQRMRSLGLPSYWGLLVPALILMDAWLLMFLGPDLEGHSFDLDLRLLREVYFSLLAVALVIAMSLAKPPRPYDDSMSSTAGRVVAVLGFFVVFLVALRILTFLALSISLAFSPIALATLSSASADVQALICMLFGCSAIWFAVRSRRDANGNDQGGMVSSRTE